MADYIGCGRTNMFRVTDEKKYKDLITGFPDNTIFDTEIDKFDNIRHFIGSNDGSLEWYKPASQISEIQERIAEKKDFYDKDGNIITPDQPLDAYSELYDENGSLIFDRFDPEDGDCDIMGFIHALQDILPPDEAFIYVESGHQKLQYVGGYSIFVTNCNIESTNLEKWANNLVAQRGINKLIW